MKKNQNIMEYVEKYKYKYGISYATEDSSLIKNLSIFFWIAWAYTFFMTMLFVLSTLIMLKFGSVDFSYIKNDFITIVSSAVVMIVGAVLYTCKKKIAGSIVTFASQPFMVLAFLNLSRDSADIINKSFYWRHFAPAVILMLLSACIAIILIAANCKTNKLYNTLVDGLYAQYGTVDGEKLTEEQWQEFLTAYNPYKQS